MAKRAPRMPYLGREYGFARYQRLKDYDFSPGEKYFASTEPFWAEVRAAWGEIAQRDARFTLKAPVDQGRLFEPFFEYAQELADGKGFDRDVARAFIDRTLRDSYLAKPRD